MENLHIHLVSARANAPFLERLRLFEKITAAVFIDPPVPKDGYMELTHAPGLGLTPNMDFIKERDEAPNRSAVGDSTSGRARTYHRTGSSLEEKEVMKMLIGEKWVDSSDKKTMEIVNPATGEVLDHPGRQ